MNVTREGGGSLKPQRLRWKFTVQKQSHINNIIGLFILKCLFVSPEKQSTLSVLGLNILSFLTLKFFNKSLIFIEHSVYLGLSSLS